MVHPRYKRHFPPESTGRNIHSSHQGCRVRNELKTDRHQLDEVVVVSNRSSHVQRSAFNALDLSVKEMHNTSKSLGETLSQLPGLKLRESGGVGSDAQLSLDGFSGKHVKIFIDGVPQEGAGAALDINNLPVNFAERIEVYKGVVPVGFGSDALGGVINIVRDCRLMFSI